MTVTLARHTQREPHGHHQHVMAPLASSQPKEAWIVGKCDNSTGRRKMETEDVELSLVVNCRHWARQDATKLDGSDGTMMLLL